MYCMMHTGCESTLQSVVSEKSNFNLGFRPHGVCHTRASSTPRLARWLSPCGFPWRGFCQKSLRRRFRDCCCGDRGHFSTVIPQKTCGLTRHLLYVKHTTNITRVELVNGVHQHFCAHRYVLATGVESVRRKGVG